MKAKFSWLVLGAVSVATMASLTVACSSQLDEDEDEGYGAFAPPTEKTLDCVFDKNGTASFRFGLETKKFNVRSKSKRDKTTGKDEYRGQFTGSVLSDSGAFAGGTLSMPSAPNGDLLDLVTKVVVRSDKSAVMTRHYASPTSARKRMSKEEGDARIPKVDYEATYNIDGACTIDLPIADAGPAEASAPTELIGADCKFDLDGDGGAHSTQFKVLTATGVDIVYLYVIGDAGTPEPKALLTKSETSDASKFAVVIDYLNTMTPTVISGTTSYGKPSKLVVQKGTGTTLAGELSLMKNDIATVYKASCDPIRK